jgi:RNA polymerase sigma factor (sigma-70 family)
MPAPRLVPPAPGSLPERPDDELMTLAQAGSREAFEVLVTRHAERLVHACARLVGNGDTGAELAQETWVVVWTGRAHYRAQGKFVVWLLTAARNRCRNHLRHRGAVKQHASRAAAEGVASASPEQIDRLLDEERRRRVREALAKLPDRMREALLLRYAEELRYDEMVDVLDAGESTLRSRVHHGLRLLRGLLEKGT